MLDCIDVSLVMHYCHLTSMTFLFIVCIDAIEVVLKSRDEYVLVVILPCRLKIHYRLNTVIENNKNSCG